MNWCRPMGARPANCKNLKWLWRHSCSAHTISYHVYSASSRCSSCHPACPLRRSPNAGARHSLLQRLALQPLAARPAAAQQNPCQCSTQSAGTGVPAIVVTGRLMSAPPMCAHQSFAGAPQMHRSGARCGPSAAAPEGPQSPRARPAPARPPQPRDGRPNFETYNPLNVMSQDAFAHLTLC